MSWTGTNKIEAEQKLSKQSADCSIHVDADEGDIAKLVNDPIFAAMFC
jgi:hypothetical protein